MEKSLNKTAYGEIAKVHSNSLLGVIGALMGALLGATLWVILSQIGIIASIAGIAIVYCACKGYILFSKSKGLGGIITAILVSVIVLVAAVFLCWGLDIYNELITEAHAITLWDAILSVPTIAFTGDFVVEFVKELLMGFILIVVGGTPFIRQAVRYTKIRQGGN